MVGIDAQRLVSARLERRNARAEQGRGASEKDERGTRMSHDFAYNKVSRVESTQPRQKIPLNSWR
jgi:predicted GNAT family N-acyltransferase